MGKAIKALSVLLIVASLFGLAGGSLSLKDALSSKDYWQNASGGGDSIGMLEDGLNQLKENEQAYLDGRDQLTAGKEAYDAGVKQYEEGKAQYEEGAQTLKDKQAEYDAGVQALADAKDKLRAARRKLEEGQKQYDDGVAALDQARALQAGLSQLASGFGNWQQGYQGLKAFQSSAASLGIDLPDPSAGNVDVYDQAIVAVKDKLSTALGYCDQLDTLKSQKAQLEAALAGKPSKEELQANKTALESALAGKPSKEELETSKAQLEAAIAQAKEAEQDTTALETQLAQVNAGIEAYNNLDAVNAGLTAYDNLDKVNAGIAQIEAGLGGQTRESLTATLGQLDQLTGVPKAVADGQKTLAAGTSQAINGALGNETMAAALTGKSGMSADQLKAAVGALGSMDYSTFNSTMATLVALGKDLSAQLGTTIAEGEKALADAAKQLEDGYAKYRNGMKQYNDGKAQLEAGAVLLEEGKAKLEEAAKQLEEGKVQLDDAAKQIADGEAQLAVFENGRDQVIAGLDTAIGTEAYAGVESIAERLGDDFSYMKNETDLDIDKGLEVVGAARAYAADTADAVTREITNKVIGAVIALAGAAVALLGGLLGLFLKKPAISGVVALLGGAAAVGGAIFSVSAGSFFSQLAGAAGPTLLTAAGAVTAVAAVLQAISAFTANKKAPV